MDVRAQLSMVFHLDKCIGCHTCSLACKNLWTSREGAEYMWWNNVETKPGTGYPSLWEDQNKYRGGWELKGRNLKPRIGQRLNRLSSLFYNPSLPTLDDYYEPWSYQYQQLFGAPQADDQPTARPVSKITGDYLEVQAGPNWDDDLGGSKVYARQDFNLADLSEAEREAVFKIERMVYFYLPRICNHCLNPSCVAVCPSGAIYKRAEDGIVLVNQDACRGWRFCVSGCPYKKTYYNWSAGKSEKCILCYPRVETGQAPACFHSCVGRIRYMGILLYDAERIEETARLPEARLVEGMRDLILDPGDPEVVAAARKSGIAEDWIAAARQSPVYKFVKLWQIALPLHSEFRTLPMLYYVPPLLPVLASQQKAGYDLSAADFFGTLDNLRVPLKYLARLFGAGNEEVVKTALLKLGAVRAWGQFQNAANLDESQARKMMAAADCGQAEVDAIMRLTALPRFQDRFVLPPYHREEATAALLDPGKQKGQAGFGVHETPRRGP